MEFYIGTAAIAILLQCAATIWKGGQIVRQVKENRFAILDLARRNERLENLWFEEHKRGG